MKKLFATLLSLHLILAPMPALAAGGGGGIAKQILGIGNSIVGSTVIVKCAMASMQPSLMVYMAGSLVYVASELAGGNKQKEQQTKQSQTLDNLKANMTEGGDYQKGAIDAQLKDEKDKLEVIQGRRKWMMATKAIYATATGLAIMEYIMSLPPPPAGPGILKPDIGACAPNPAANMPVTAAIALAYSGISAYASSGVMGAATTVAIAGADFVFKLGIGATVADMTMTALNTSLGRVAVFAAATALVMVVDGELAKEESDTKKRIADLEKVKDQFYMESASETKLAEGSSNSDMDKDAKAKNEKNEYELKTLANGPTGKKNCFSTTKNATLYGEDSCSNPMKLTRPNLDPKFSVPTLVAASNTSTDLGQAIANGDMASADVEAGKLASMAGRIEAMKDNMMKKLNADLKAQGKKPISIEDTLSTQLSAFNKALNEKKPGSGNYTMDDLGFGSNSKAGRAEVSAPDLASTKGTTQDINAVSAAPNGDAGVAAAPVSNLSFEDADADSSTEANPYGEELFGRDKLASANDGLNGSDKNASGEEISRDRDVSIFKQVSNRYLLNYTRIFNRKEIKAPMAEAEAAQ